MPKMTLYTRKKYIYLFYLHGKYDKIKRGADVLVSRKMFALLLFMQTYIILNNGLSWPQVWEHVL